MRLALGLAVTFAAASCGGSSGSSTARSTVPDASLLATLPSSSLPTSTDVATTVSRVSTDPCASVSDDHVGAPWGGTATKLGNTVDTNPQECTWQVDGPLAGKVEITVSFPDPSSMNSGASDAVSMVQYRHDFLLQNYPDKAADIEVVTGVGQYAYLDTWTRSLHVALSPDLAVSVQWVSASTADFGTPISDAVRAALSASALAVGPDLAGA